MPDLHDAVPVLIKWIMYILEREKLSGVTISITMWDFTIAYSADTLLCTVGELSASLCF